jgi:hypothetical protein
MHRLVVAAAFLLAVACAAPTPTPSTVPTLAPTLTPPPTPTTSPTTHPTPYPTQTPAPTAPVSPTVTPTATGPTPRLPGVVQRELEGWQVTCVDVEFVDCHGVAALFVNNLAWNTGWVLDQSGGMVTVAARRDCPALEHFDATSCWQARAPIEVGDVCMVVARQLPEIAWKFGFGQVGGDDLTGRLGPPPNWPLCV